MQTTTEKIELIGSLILGEIKLWSLKKVYFESKKLKSITILHFITTLNNVALKIGRVFKAIIKTRNVNDKC